jgi:hypothetical protein
MTTTSFKWPRNSGREDKLNLKKGKLLKLRRIFREAKCFLRS